MWYSPSRCNGRRNLKDIVSKSCLLIGNSRWHWAFKKKDGWAFEHTQPKPEKIKSVEKHTFNWAAVGPIPKGVSLIKKQNISIEHIPLKKVPSWIGVDRGLAAWGAYLKAKKIQISSKYILIIDAGTVLSITRLKLTGEFAGGQLVAGLKLQIESMAKGAKNLMQPNNEDIPTEYFPFSTEAAMKQGSLQSLIGIIVQASQKTKSPIWLCGGDSYVLIDELKKYHIETHFCPNLVLEGMIDVQSKFKQAQGHLISD